MPFCERLERVDILYSSLDNCGDLMGIANWNRGTVIANHCAQRGWHWLVGNADWGHHLGELSTEEDWRETQELWLRAQACVGHIGRGDSYLVRPGLPRFTSNTFDALRMTPAMVSRYMLHPAFSIEWLFTEHADRVATPDLVRLAQARTLGKSDATRVWIAGSSSEPADQEGLTAFVEKFPNIVFYRWNESATDPALPEWFRAQERTLGGWMPHRPLPTVRFASFDSEGWSPRDSYVASIPYVLGRRGHGNDGSRELLERAGFVIVALSRDGVNSTLAIRTDGDDRRVYEYCHEDILDAMSDDRDITQSIYPVFRSYAAMLSHITEIEPVDIKPHPGGRTMTFTFPQFDQPNTLDADRTWVALYDSYDQRNEDAYYVITVHDGEHETARFVAKVGLWWAEDDWTSSDFVDRLRRELHHLAGEGETNTSYQGWRTTRET
ncbi:hypothetical protein JOF56_009574 [Kibdelosporangium banguiense]|uniref:Uncharacterized protein n=1 Tax=Kibdelosporangium banguiense TaxID=1365924 RepID=A0ABS4TXT1_9PSEU|nr:hypothetical protein [Kibdelosporangium banguiense]MBP2329189.1 hypothetical protein [Kibdelosporangium banguiense]